MTNLKPMSRRRFMQTAAAVSSAATLGGVLTACGGSNTGSATVTIKYWDWMVTQGPWVDNEISLFQKANPNIKVSKKTQVVAQYPTLYSLAVKSGNTPDVGMIPQQPDFNTQVLQGWFLPVDKWANDSWRSKFPKGTFHEGSNMFNGKTYSAPLTGPSPWCQLYVNNQVFKDAGLTNSDGTVKVPQTWDEVGQAADAIVKKSGGNTYGFGFGGAAYFPFWLEVFLLAAGSPGGGYGMDLRIGKYTWASDPNYTTFLKLWKSWKDKGYFYPDSMSISDEVARNYFSRNKFGMIINGVWCEPEWTQAGFTDYSINTVIPPEMPRKGYFPTSPGGTYFAISSKTKHPDESWAWFSWLYSVDAGKRWVQMGEDLSVFPQNNDPKVVQANKPFAEFVALSNLAVPAPDISVRNPETGFVQPQSVKPGLGDIMQGYYTGQISDIHAALSDLQDKMQKAQDDAVKQAQQQGHKVSADDYIFPDWDVTKPYYTKPKNG